MKHWKFSESMRQALKESDMYLWSWQKKLKNKSFWNFNFWLEIKDKYSLVLVSFLRQYRKWNILMCAQKKMVQCSRKLTEVGGGEKKRSTVSSLLWIDRNFQNLQTPTLFIPKRAFDLKGLPMSPSLYSMYNGRLWFPFLIFRLPFNSQC